MEPSANRLRAASGEDKESDTVIFNVGGQCFEILRYKIESQPSTMLASLLSDIGTDVVSGKPLFVDANPDRFQYILDWYRYGELFVPSHCSIKAILRDCRFFMLPDSVKINGHIHLLEAGGASVERVHEEFREKVVSQWPNFAVFVASVVSEAKAHFMRSAERSAMAEDLQIIGNCTIDPTNDINWYTTPLTHGYGKWSDEANVCSMARLEEVIRELRRSSWKKFAMGILHCRLVCHHAATPGPAIPSRLKVCSLRCSRA